MSFPPRMATGAEKLMGGNSTRRAGTKRDTKLFSVLGTLRPLETSARLSQEARSEIWDAEMLRWWDLLSCWDAELLQSDGSHLRAPGIQTFSTSSFSWFPWFPWFPPGGLWSLPCLTVFINFVDYPHGLSTIRWPVAIREEIFFEGVPYSIV